MWFTVIQYRANMAVKKYVWCFSLRLVEQVRCCFNKYLQYTILKGNEQKEQQHGKAEHGNSPACKVCGQIYD